MNETHLFDYGEYLLKLALSKTNNFEQAEDLVSETLISAIVALKNGTKIGNPKTYLSGILNHKFYDFLRSKYSKPVISYGVIPDFEIAGREEESESVLEKIPTAKLVLYIVDDWVGTSGAGRLFTSFWKKENENLFNRLLNKSAVLFSICSYMSEDYKIRYKKTFIPVHNPVDIKLWNSIPFKRKYDENVKSILYVGKINQDTEDCLLDVAKVIQSLSNKQDKKNVQYLLDIYTPNYTNFITKFDRYAHCHLFPAISHEKIPEISKSYDALLLTLGFSKRSKEYTRLSMPTKLSEYLCSGVPVILYCPSNIALAKYLSSNDCTISCFNRDKLSLKRTLLKLQDQKLVMHVVEKARILAMVHDVNAVRERFENNLIDCIKKS